MQDMKQNMDSMATAIGMQNVELTVARPLSLILLGSGIENHVGLRLRLKKEGTYNTTSDDYALCVAKNENSVDIIRRVFSCNFLRGCRIWQTQIAQRLTQDVVTL
jgi:hypothetical protein